MQVLREYPTAVEADLSHYHGIDVRDWLRWAFRGEDNGITSRRVLTFLVEMDDQSALRKAARDGDWSEAQYIQARIANELMLSRADFIVAHGGKSDPKLLLSPAQRIQDEKEREAARDVRTLIRAQLYGEFVPPPQPGRVFEGSVQKGHSTINSTGGER